MNFTLSIFPSFGRFLHLDNSSSGKLPDETFQVIWAMIDGIQQAIETFSDNNSDDFVLLMHLL